VSYDLKFEENSFCMTHNGSRTPYTPVGVLRDMMMVNGDRGDDEGEQTPNKMINFFFYV
jgi:hypothetical protein